MRNKLLSSGHFKELVTYRVTIGAAFLLAHETAHLNTYEEGKSGEESSLYMRSKVEKEDSKQQFREAEKKAYLASLEGYESKKSLAEQFAEARKVPKEEREHFPVLDFLTSSTLIEEPQIVSKEVKIQKLGEKYYYNGYRVKDISEFGKNSYKLEMDYKDAMPNTMEELSFVSGIQRLLLQPEWISKQSKSLKDFSKPRETAKEISLEEGKVVGDIQRFSEGTSIRKKAKTLKRNSDLYYEGRKIYTESELNQLGRRAERNPNVGVEYILETPPGKQNAREFQWGTNRSAMQETPKGPKNIIPALRYTNSNERGMNFIKFDGIEVRDGKTYLIDAKVNVPYWNPSAMKQYKDTFKRIQSAKLQNPDVKIIYEFPNQKAGEYFEKWIERNGEYKGTIDEIRIRN